MTKNAPIFSLAIGLHFISYFLIFLDHDLGYKFFKDGLNAFLRGQIRMSEMHIFFAFFSPLVTLPFFTWDYWIRPLFKKKTMGILFFVSFLFLPVALTVFFIIMDNGHIDDDSWGYATWLISFGLLLYLYIKKSMQQQIQEDDISKHLIENE